MVVKSREFIESQLKLFKSPKVIVIEEMSKEEAKKKICNFLNKIDGEIYPSDIASKLNIDYDLTIEIIEIVFP